MGENQPKLRRGFHWDGVNTRLETWVNGIEAIRFTPSTTGVDARLFGDTPATNYINMDASGPTLTVAGFNVAVSGTYTDDCLDFTSAALTHSGSNGPCFIRAGTYTSPVTNASESQSGLIRLYGATTAGGTSYDRGIFVCLQTTGVKGIFPIAGLAEVKAQAGVGPSKAQAAQFITMLQDDTSVLATIGADTTAGMYAAWLKVGSVTGSVASSGSRVAAVWLDNQMSGTVSGEEYTIFSTTGGTKPDAWAAFETTSSGWSNFLAFDETSYDQDPVVSADITGSTKKYLKVDFNGTAYGIHLWSVA